VGYICTLADDWVLKTDGAVMEREVRNVEYRGWNRLSFAEGIYLGRCVGRRLYHEKSVSMQVIDNGLIGVSVARCLYDVPAEFMI